MESAIGVVVAIVFTALVVGIIVLSSRGMGAKMSAFLTASTPVKITSAVLESGVKATLSTTAGSGKHGLWLDVDVVGKTNSQWSADVVIDWRAGASSGTDRFAIGYDGDGHDTGPKAHGVLFVPHADSGAGRDRGRMSLSMLPAVAAGAAIDVDVTITLTSEVESSSFDIFVGLIPDSAPTKKAEETYRG